MYSIYIICVYTHKDYVCEIECMYVTHTYMYTHTYICVYVYMCI